MGADDEPTGEGGCKSQGPIQVTDVLMGGPDLAEHGRHIDPFSLPHWRYLEVWTWVATRDFGQVAGMRRWCDDPRPDAGGVAGLIMATIDKAQPVTNAKAAVAFADLDSALANGDLQALGRKNGGDLIAMPREAWANGRFTEGDGGKWWEGTPLLSPFWTDIRISHIDVQDRFGCNSASPPIRTPVSEAWVPLTEALMWIQYHHAADIDELNRPPLAMLGQSSEHVRCLLELVWRTLANAASQGNLTIRGRPHDGSQTDRDERDLSRDDLLNCKWFDWAIGDRDAPIVSAVYRFKPDDDIAQMRGGMVNFAHVRVEREGLMRLWPVPAAITSIGAALSQQMVPAADPSRVGDLLPLAEAFQRVAASFPPIEDWHGSPERMATAGAVTDAITARLRDLLRNGTVKAYVCEPDGKLWLIPTVYWGSFHDYRPLAGAGFFAAVEHGALARRLNDLGVHVSLRELDPALKPGMQMAVTTAGAVSRLKQWLGNRLDNSSPDTITRAEIHSEARELFGVSGNAFRSVWLGVVADGRAQWSKPGRKPKS